MDKNKELSQNEERNQRRMDAYKLDNEHHHSSGEGHHHHRHHHHHHKKKKGWIAIVVVAVIVLMLGIFGIIALTNAKKVLAQANEMKGNIVQAIACIQDNNSDGAEAAIEKADLVYKKIDNTLNGGFWTFTSKIPILGEDVKSVKKLMSAYGNASEFVVKPFIEQMKQYPLSELKVDGGFNVTLINAYMDFAESIGPQIEDINKTMQNVKFKVLPKEKIEGFIGKFTGLLDTFEAFKKYAPLIRSFCGTGENKSYLVSDDEIFWLNNSSNDKIWHTNGTNVSMSDASTLYEIRPVIKLKSLVMFQSGDGTKEKPYTISKDNKIGLGSTIKLGDDQWIIYEIGDTIKLMSEKVLDKTYIFDKNDNKYDVNSKESLAE